MHYTAKDVDSVKTWGRQHS